MAAQSRFTEEIADLIIERMADGQSLREICRDEGMPSFRTVLNWVTSNPEFGAAYALAQDVRASALFDDLLGIADDGRNDWMEKHDEKSGQLIGWRENGEAIRRSALRVDARKWVLARMAPKRYGDRQTVEQTSEVTIKDRQPDWSALSRDERQVMRELLLKARPPTPSA